MPHVAHVGFILDPQEREPRELLQAWPSLVDVAEAAAMSVGRLSVVQACARSDAFSQRRVHYHFVAPRATVVPWARASRCIEGMCKLLARLRPDVIHVHGFESAAAVIRLARRLPGTPILLQDHASHPPGFWHAWRFRRGMGCAAGVAVCAREQLEPFREAQLLPAQLQDFEVPESTSRFVLGDRVHARAVTGVYGSPAVLWVGRLDANKDPLTVLEAVRRVVAALPQLELWVCHGTDELLPEVRRLVAAESALHGRVHLLGAVAHERIETLMSAADLYVSASRREGSGYALIEALACGLFPVVSDIPSFRALTGRGQVGELWRCGDAGALSASLIRAAARPREEARSLVHDYFQRELSFAALGRKLAQAYWQLLHQRTTPGGDHR